LWARPWQVLSVITLNFPDSRSVAANFRKVITTARAHQPPSAI
jgi:hypothetical protein